MPDYDLGGFEMLRFKHAALVATFAFLPAADAATNPRMPREVEYATRLVIGHLAEATSDSVRTSRRLPEKYAYHGGDVEMAIGLLGVGGEATTEGLLNLMAVGLDGAAAEERECQIGKRGKTLIPALTRFSPTRAARWCRNTFESLRKRELSDLEFVSINDICRPVSDVEADRKEWLRALKSGPGCGFE